MFKGTDKRSAKEIASDIDKLGGQINAFTGKEATCYYVKTTGNNLLKAADVLVDMITASRFDKEEMDRERLVICEEIKMTSDTPDDLAIDEGLHLVLESSSLGNSILGTPSSLKKITGNVMHNYVRDKYTLDKIVVSVAGKFNEEKLREFFENAFDSMYKKQLYTEKRQGEYKARYKSIKKDIEADFRERLFDRVARNCDAEYLFQSIDSLLDPKEIPQTVNRKKPWGTIHAVLCAKDAVKTPFATACELDSTTS